MVIISVKFHKDFGKIYEYLLLNPKKYKINKDKPLIFTKGYDGKSAIVSTLYAVNVRKEDKLPDIVTAQVVILDNNNNILIQHIDGCEYIKEFDTSQSKSIYESPVVSETPIKKLPDEYQVILDNIISMYRLKQSQRSLRHIKSVCKQSKITL